MGIIIFELDFFVIVYSLIGTFLFIFSSLNLWKKNALVCGTFDVEDDFEKYLRNIDAADSSALLRSVASAGQPEALLILGAMIYSGEKYAENKNLGAKYIKFAIAEGAKEPGLSIVNSLGIDVDNLERGATAISPEEAGINLALQCQTKIHELFESGRLNEDLRVDFLGIVRSVELLHLANILAILNTDTELDNLARNAARITGWDAENAIFFVEE